MALTCSGVLAFATAHSRGLRRYILVPFGFSRNALPQRIRAGCDDINMPRLDDLYLCHSAFVRVATAHRRFHPSERFFFATAHSCGLRLPDGQEIADFFGLCHSAFVRVATAMRSLSILSVARFATAHSCGLRLRRKGTGFRFHPLPQRIRAGCDCGKAMQRTANLLREGR